MSKYEAVERVLKESQKINQFNLKKNDSIGITWVLVEKMYWYNLIKSLQIEGDERHEKHIHKIKEYHSV